MLSLSFLQPRIFYLFRLAGNATIEIPINYRNKVYILTIEPTEKTHKVNNRHKMAKRKNGIKILTKDCPNCGGVEMNGICLAKVCTPKNQPQ